ncbi:MAG: hypothetical protein HC914_20285 [Chloroflexaceae bacterium]|nr:hypothetical protein [Chloroflexaceae bacterium]
MQVQQNDLGHLVPVVRVEKRAGRGGYYLFLAIESSVIGEVPEEVQSSLLRFHLLGHALDQPFTFDEIRQMVGAEHAVHDYVRLIPYVRPLAAPASDPFEETGVEELEKVVASNDIAMQTQQYDHLLGWLSSTGQGSWQVFQNTWQVLGGKDRPQQVLRRLRLLGHMETSADRKRWTMAPSVIFPITSGDRAGQWVLCGRRDMRLIQSFRQHTGVEVRPQAYGDGPATVYLHMKNPEHLTTIIETIGRPVYQVKQAGLTLAQVLPSLDGWKQSLESLQGIRPYAYTLKCFNGNGFAEVNFSGGSGLYELWPLEGRSTGRGALHPEYILYYDEAGDRWLRADWYGLRFLARYDADQSCPVQFSTALSQLAVHIDWRWPEIYERALVLASGRLPSRQKGWLIYDNVGIELFEELRDKLRLSDEEVTNA